MMLTEMNSLLENPFKYFLLGLQEILNPVDWEKLTGGILGDGKSHTAISEQKAKKIRLTMTEMYGEEGTKGLLMCSGRAAFKHLLEEQGKELGFESDIFRFSPGRIKMKRGLELLAKWMSGAFGEAVSVQSLDKSWLLVVQRDEKHIQDDKRTGLCDYLAGLIQGFLFWAGGGRYFGVRETECYLVEGRNCCFMIDKFPLD